MSRTARAIPGLPLTLGYTVFYVSALVLLPLSALLIRTAQLSWAEFRDTITDPVVVASYRLTFGASAMAALINAMFGLLSAWVLVRYRFPGRRIFDALIDFPFALPTAVAGLTFSNLYLDTGWIGGLGTNLATLVNAAARAMGQGEVLAADSLSWLNVALTNTNGGIVLVLIFVGLPFVVRTVQPVLQELDPEYELAAESLGAGPVTIFRRVIFPELFPAWIAGVSLAFARAVGEYGSVIFIASNIPGRSQIAPLQIVSKLNNFQYPQATAVGVVLLAASLVILLLINAVESWIRRRSAT